MIKLSVENNIIRLAPEISESVEEMKTTQEEADTKLNLYSNYYLQKNTMIYSPSGDTDIILSAALVKAFKNPVFFIDGHGENKKHFLLSSIDLDDDIIDSLIGFHACTGNDFVSSFFRKGKKKCFEILNRKSKFQNEFSTLGDAWEITDKMLNVIQLYICQLYNSKKSFVNELRFESFFKKYQNLYKIGDMSTLPPCLEVLKLYLQRSLYIAALWKQSTVFLPILPNMNAFGRNDDGSIKWVNEIYPKGNIRYSF